MRYRLFLFDLDDTLLDFRASEKLSFGSALKSLGLPIAGDGPAAGPESVAGAGIRLGTLFTHYQEENRRLWAEFERGETTKEFLKVERFRRIFARADLALDPELAARRYLEALPESVVLVEHAREICEYLTSTGAEIGIVTNGISETQTLRLKKSGLEPYISFMSVSEECGFAKPDVRFFEHSVKRSKIFAEAKASPAAGGGFTREHTLVIGDRLETDVLGAHNFGVDACWFNPSGEPAHIPQGLPCGRLPRYQIRHLSELRSFAG